MFARVEKFLKSDILKNIKFEQADYKEVCETCESGDLVVMDPPYDGSRARYSEASVPLQVLRDVVDKLTVNNVRVILFNQNKANVRVCFKGYRQVQLTKTNRKNKKIMNELVIINYEMEKEYCRNDFPFNYHCDEDESDKSEHKGHHKVKEFNVDDILQARFDKLRIDELYR